MLKLYIGNKNYSSWSMRPWVLLRQTGIAFEEVKVRFDSFDAGSGYRQVVDKLTPAGKVPVLLDGDLVVWDTLAIAEYLAEQFPDKQFWPRDARDRARARSICAEMHSGFGALRSACPMNIEAELSGTGRLIWRDKPAVRADVARIVAMWGELLARHGGTVSTAGPPQGAKAPSGGSAVHEVTSVGAFLFGDFCIADAYFAPVAMRLKTYALPVPPEISAYVERLSALPGVKAWIDEALAEKDFREFEEPYRLSR